MSFSTRKQTVSLSASGLRDRVAQAGSQVSTQVGTLAGKTVPLAQNAGMTVRQGRDTAVARATPVVDAARSWAAPQLEQSAHAISDTIAPMISSALLSAAHKIEVPKRKSRLNPGVVAGAVLLTAAAGAATAAAVRMRRQPNGTASGNGSAPVTEPVTSESEPPDADMNGHSRIV